jgi:hypothetical protein
MPIDLPPGHAAAARTIRNFSAAEKIRLLPRSGGLSTEAPPALAGTEGLSPWARPNRLRYVALNHKSAVIPKEWEALGNTNGVCRDEFDNGTLPGACPVHSP